MKFTCNVITSALSISYTQIEGRMRIHQVQIKNFRLLADVELVLEEQTTVIVGRNNNGKTESPRII
ncbi:AAA family ATPase [Citrobacter braakii]|uniref:AAA family ATPase n=1 Tax=Citrobacter braakii TaxID=57706 RepID=UPI002A35B7CD|nr:AAA family ATPase [Citrobacter braakii]